MMLQIEPEQFKDLNLANVLTQTTDIVSWRESPICDSHTFSVLDSGSCHSVFYKVHLNCRMS